MLACGSIAARSSTMSSQTETTVSDGWPASAARRSGAGRYRGHGTRSCWARPSGGPRRWHGRHLPGRNGHAGGYTRGRARPRRCGRNSTAATGAAMPFWAKVKRKAAGRPRPARGSNPATAVWGTSSRYSADRLDIAGVRLARQIQALHDDRHDPMAASHHGANFGDDEGFGQNREIGQHVADRLHAGLSLAPDGGAVAGYP